MTLHLLRLPVLPLPLLACGREHRLLDDTRSVDLGYLVHSLFSRLWDKAAPKPFDIQDAPAGGDAEGAPLSARPLVVLAYAAQDLRASHADAQASGDPAALSAVDWRNAGSKPMPDLPAGHRCGFRVRVCPTIRAGKQHPRFAQGAEIDPYLSLIQRALALQEAASDSSPAVLKQEIIAAAPPREAVYRDWLASRLAGVAQLEIARLVSQSDAMLWRRGEPGPGAPQRMYGRDRGRYRNRAVIGRRAAVFEGTLQVVDPLGFQAMLARGIGRHRHFGFGMLLLRPVAG